MATERLTILTICGSLRERSYNAALARQLPSMAPPGTVFRAAPSFAGIPLYNADERGDDFPAPVVELAEAVLIADAVIFVTPEYNWSVPGGLKNALDWISRMPGDPFKGKPTAIQSVTTGMLGGARMQYHLRMILTSLQCGVFGTPEIFVGGAAAKFDPDTLELTDPATRTMIEKQLALFAAFAARHRAG